jgi:hypothetical protein
MFHKNFPFGKGAWIWYLKNCLNGDVEAIISKCHAYDISYLVIKSGNGEFAWDQFSTELVKKLHDANIKVYSWSFVVGDDPVKEAQVAIHSLGRGADGHVFDAEGSYENLPNNGEAAETMLKLVREKYPEAFLAYSSFPIIDYHIEFPYITFGKYCDATMPQVYYGTMGLTPREAIIKMYNNATRWHKNWIDSGYSDSVKPIIPLAQAYDNHEISPPYYLKPSDILDFVSIVKGYKSVSFWSFQHILRPDCWEAIRDAQLDRPSDADRGVQAQPVQTQTVQEATEAQTPPQESTTPAQTEPAEGIQEQPVQEEPAVPVEVATPEETTTVTEPEIEAVDTTTPVEQPEVVTTTTASTDTVTTSMQDVPVVSSQTFDAAFQVSADKPTTIVVTPNDKHPDGMEVKVYVHKTHREYFVEFVKYVLSLLQIKSLIRRK